MPTTRELTPEELQNLANQGIDPEQYRGKQVTLASDEELASQQPPATTGRQAMSKLGAVGATAKSHIGGWAGGGAAALGTGALLAEIFGAPETLGGSLLAIPPTLAAAYGGSYVGQKAQEKLQSDETNKAQALAEQQAQEEHPFISGATDIAGSALLSGGKPNLSNIPKALTGERAAISKIAMNALVNPAINTGVQVATTGQLPTLKDVASQVAGGALFSESSALGRLGHGRGEPVAEPTAKDNSQGQEQVAPAADDHVNAGPVSPYRVNGFDGAPLISDGNVKEAFNKLINPKPSYEGMTPEQQYAARTAWSKGNKTDVEGMREALHQRFLSEQQGSTPVTETPTVEPTQKTVVEKPYDPVEYAEQLNNERLSQQRAADYKKALAERDAQNNTPATADNPITANQARIINPDTLLGNNLGREEVRPEVKENEVPINKEEPLTDAERLEAEEDRRQYGNKYSPQTDKQQYDTLYGKMKEMVAAGQIHTPEFMALWKEMESVKNKNGGMPPVEKNSPLNEDSQASQDISTHLGDGKQKPLASVLQRISSSNSPFQSLANHFLNTVSLGKLTVPVAVTDTGRSHYDIGNKAINLQQQHAGDIPVIIHEAAHALTSNHIPLEWENLRGETLKKAMDNYLSDPTKNDNVKEIIRCYYEVAKNLGIHEQLFTDAGKREGKAPYVRGLAGMPDAAKESLPHGYAMGDVHEFIAGLLSNKEFQEKTNEMPSGLGDGKSLWSRIVEAIRNVLGVPVKEGSLLERALKPIDELSKSERPENVRRGSGEIRSPNEEERISKSAYKTPEGTIHTGDWHYNALEKVPTKYQHSSKDGFVTNKGRFVTREQALHIAKKAGQLYERAEHDYATGALTKLDSAHLRSDATDMWKDENNKYSPPPEEIKREDKHMGWLGNVTRSMVDKIRDIPHPSSKIVADAFDRTLTERNERVGVTWNKIKSTMDKYNFTKADGEALQRVSEWENLHKEVAPSSMLRTQAQREVYKVERQVYDESGKYRIANKEPVYREGRPTMLVQDPYAHPTTPNPKVVETYKSNTDTKEIARLDKIFLDNAVAHGKTPEEAAEALRTFKTGVQGNMRNEGGNLQFYNAARRAQGIPLPPEFARTDYAKNLEAYYHRQATDNTFFKNVEANPKVLSALGETHDAWNRPITPDANGGVAAHPAVQSQLKEFQGEKGGMGFHNEKAISSLATTLFISNPALEIHKAVSNLVGITNYADNPVQLGRMLGAMVKNFTTGVEHATDNGIVKLTARSLGDFWDTNATMAERMQALAHGIKKVSSLGVLTDKWSTGLMQAGAEAALPMKIKNAANGDRTAQQLLVKLDPSYTVGKQYDAAGVSKLASSLASYIHGTGDGRTIPAFMANDTELSGFFKLAHWSVSQTNRFMSDVYTPATKGNYTPLMMSLFGSAIGGYLIKELREKIQGKHGQIPSLDEVAASDRGLSGNKGLLAYNLIAATQYAGFGGLLSQIAKYPMDFAYKNNPQGATFPLDEIAGDMAKTLGQVSTAIANDPNINWLNLVEHVMGHVITTNFQMGRVAYNQAINNGLIDGTLAEKKLLSDKMGALRRFQMVSGLPFEDQSQDNANPYMNLEQKKFKTTQNIEEAAKMLPQLVNNIMETYAGKPDVIASKLEALKQNQYATFPSMDKMPISFVKYLGYLQRHDGPEQAQAALQDYLKHKAVNEVKASVVP